MAFFFLALVIVTTQLKLSRSEVSSFASQFNTAFRDVQIADLSGATTEEVHGLVTQLNSVLQTEDRLNTSSSQNTTMRIQLREQINSTLTAIEDMALEAATDSAAKTSKNHLIAYSLAPIGAAFGTIVYYYCVLLWHKYRIKRLFRMKINLRER